MRRLLFLLAGVLLSGTLMAQKPFVVFGHVPKVFGSETVDRTVKATGDFLWSLDAVVSGAQITFNNETDVFETSFLSGVGGAIGYKFYKPLEDGSAISTWGVSGALLTKVKLNEVVETGLEAAILLNVYNFTAGPVYIFGDKKLGLLVGANISF